MIEPVGQRNWIWSLFMHWFKALCGKFLDTHIAIDHATVCRVVMRCEEVDSKEGGASPRAICKTGIVPAIPSMNYPMKGMGGLQSYLQ